MSPTLRRLMKEAAELSESSPSPSPHFEAHPVTDSNLFEWHFTLAGPPAPSPYAGGIYHGRISLPWQYPLRPPMFRFLTPSGRFQVNQEICLSISGHHEESWQPAWGIRLALTAIRSFMDGDAKGQLGGVEANAETRRELAKRSASWKCEGCGSRTNEEVMREWRNICSTKGVNVDEEGNETIPEGLKVGFKKPKENQAQTPTQSAPTTDRAAAITTSTSVNQAKVTVPKRIPIIGSTSAGDLPGPAMFEPPQPTTSSPANASTASFVSSASSATTIPSARTPTVTTTGTQPTRSMVAQRPMVTQTQIAPSGEPVPAWIDKAIATIVVMLIGMVIKKIYYS